MASTNYLGNDWSWYPATNESGYFNIVSGVHAVASRILHIILTQPGEDPIHPGLGIIPNLFASLSSDNALFFLSNIQSEILAWNNVCKIGIKELNVQIESLNIYRNDLAISIYFKVIGLTNTTNVLTFGYWEYRGVLASGSLTDFMANVRLNNTPFSSHKK